MKKLAKYFQIAVVTPNRVNYRDREAHYASGVMTCLRDQYWSWLKEPETNPTDLTGAMKMLVGDAIEKQLVSFVFNQLAADGYLVKTQVPIGGTNPLGLNLRPWHGYLDIQVARKIEDGSWLKFPIEVKTKSGYGADKFWNKMEIDKGYMLQLGLYLSELYKKGGITDGLFLYVLLSDNHFGDVVFIHCRFDPGTNSMYAYYYEKSDGSAGSLEQQVEVTEAFSRWKKLDEALEARREPVGEYKYKYELTPEFLRELSDAQLKKLIDGVAVTGDWQPLYSRYKDKQLLVDKIRPERTDEERALARSEYRRRHPRSKI